MESREVALREELVRGCQVLFKLEIADMIGHLSARLDDDRILIKPRPVSWLARYGSAMASTCNACCGFFSFR